MTSFYNKPQSLNKIFHKIKLNILKYEHEKIEKSRFFHQLLE